MNNILCRNVNQALSMTLCALEQHGVKETSRNGDVMVFPTPVMITCMRPLERVLFAPMRDANPFFHLMESLWMLAGRNDIAFPAYFNKNFATYTDDGVTHPGAYGYRWRIHFGVDQLPMLAEELKTNPDTRRAVLAMWDGGINGRPGDLQRSREGTKDAPCNLVAMFDRRGGRLNLTVCQRSGDLWWGTLGANAVQFSVLLEYMAFAVGCPVGELRQFVNNLHAYAAVVPPAQLLTLAHDAEEADAYPLQHFPLINTTLKVWEGDLQLFFRNLDANPVMPKFQDVFFRSVVWPMYRAWRQRKEKHGNGVGYAECIAAQDWRRACVGWIERREK